MLKGARAQARSRVRELVQVRIGDILPFEGNPKIHTVEQKATLQALIDEVGISDAVLVRRRGDGKLVMVDGHGRQDMDPDQIWPALVLDVDESEARTLVATLDPIAGLAITDAELYRELAGSVETSEQAVAKLIENVLREAEVTPEAVEQKDVELRNLQLKAPPSMTWVLIGIATTQFGMIAETIEKMAELEGIVCEVTSNSGTS